MLGHGKEGMQSACQPERSLGLLRNAGGSDRCRAGQGDRFQSLALVVHITFHARHQVRNLIVALFQQDVDIREGTVVFVAQSDQFVVHDDRVNRRPGHEQDERSGGEERHRSLLGNVAKGADRGQVTTG